MIGEGLVASCMSQHGDCIVQEREHQGAAVYDVRPP